MSFTPEQTAKIEMLTGLGLPEEQAKKSVATDVGEVAATKPCHCYYMLKIPDGCDMDKLKEYLAEYSTNAKKSKGKVSCSHTICNGEVLSVEIMNSPAAMDNHIGNCFPSYVKMLGLGVVNTEIIAIVDEGELDWWKGSLGAWGASKLCISAPVV